MLYYCGASTKSARALLKSLNNNQGLARNEIKFSSLNVTFLWVPTQNVEVICHFVEEFFIRNAFDFTDVRFSAIFFVTTDNFFAELAITKPATIVRVINILCTRTRGCLTMLSLNVKVKL